ncbi:MAG: RraA family protein [Candidatus Tectomicrobia bacterium]|nr:RraA family protein [Candidatus Tectomicrobia bacterium]MBI3024538.1 RraA family protein [Candidatus Tectomicrobia bacterium]
MSDTRLERLLALSTCQVADAIDKLKIRGHMPDIIMLSPDTNSRVAGPAHTVLMVPAGGAPVEKLPAHHVDATPKGSVVVISCPPGTTAANWGGLMSTRARTLGAAAAVVDGRARDIEEHRAMGFPVFARGVSIHGSTGYTSVASYGAPIACGGVTVRQGDIVLGDINGVVVIPQERFDEVLAKTEELARIEEKVTRELEAGATITATFAKYR